MSELILSQEQKALAANRKRASREGQGERFSIAVMRALNNTNEDIVMEGDQPSLQAALDAVVGAQAWLITKADDRAERRRLLAECEKAAREIVRQSTEGGLL